MHKTSRFPQGNAGLFYFNFKYLTFLLFKKFFLIVIASEAKQSPVYQSKVKSLHIGFNLLIKAIFFFLEPPLICFSLLMAS